MHHFIWRHRATGLRERLLWKNTVNCIELNWGSICWPFIQLREDLTSTHSRHDQLKRVSSHRFSSEVKEHKGSCSSAGPLRSEGGVWVALHLSRHRRPPYLPAPLSQEATVGPRDKDTRPQGKDLIQLFWLRIWPNKTVRRAKLQRCQMCWVGEWEVCLVKVLFCAKTGCKSSYLLPHYSKALNAEDIWTFQVVLPVTL